MLVGRNTNHSLGLTRNITKGHYEEKGSTEQNQGEKIFSIVREKEGEIFSMENEKEEEIEFQNDGEFTNIDGNLNKKTDSECNFFLLLNLI